MKPENIALFKRFLKTEGCNVLFGGMYSQAHPEGMPDDVEEYLRQVDAKEAILSAFKFPEKGSTFGVDYWFAKAVKWEKVLMSATTEGFYGWCWHNKDSVIKEANKPLERVSAYLHAYSSESKKEKKKNSQEISYIESLSNDTKKEEPAKLDAWTGKDFKKEEPKPEPIPRGVTEEQMALNGFKMFSVKTLVRTKIPEGKISLNTKSGHTITFNLFVSKEIENSKHKYIHVFSKESAIYFLFDDSQKDGVEWRISNNVRFSHKSLITNIKEFFGIKEDQFLLTISKNMSKTEKNLFYKITNK